jgi:hypothetical protein
VISAVISIEKVDLYLHYRNFNAKYEKYQKTHSERCVLYRTAFFLLASKIK